MTQRKGTGLLMVWCEVPDEVEDEFNRWYNEEHIEERLSISGVLSAARYEAVMSGPKHLAVYELENSAVMESEEYLKVRSNPTEWSQRMSPEYTATIYVRNVYEMVHPSGLTDEIASSPMAPALQIGRMDIPGGHGRRVEPLVQHGLYPELRDGSGRDARKALHGRHRLSQVHDDVRVRPHRGLEGSGMAHTADGAPRQRSYARGNDPPAGVAGSVAEDV